MTSQVTSCSKLLTILPLPCESESATEVAAVLADQDLLDGGELQDSFGAMHPAQPEDFNTAERLGRGEFDGVGADRP